MPGYAEMYYRAWCYRQNKEGLSGEKILNKGTVEGNRWIANRPEIDVDRPSQTSFSF
jgi:hypothetical protein